jgi:uncharacterized repeat protein (TIGR03803 family)
MTRHHSILAAPSLIACLLALTLAASAATETVLHSFSQQPRGATSRAGLVSDTAGNLYGTTSRGGAFGVVFRLSPNAHGQWTQTVLHNFTGGYTGPDGTYPQTSLTFDSAGNLYGTTQGGGTYGCGTVYKLTPVTTGPWKESILHSFACYPSDGSNPDGSLIFDSAGNLYGVTYVGGSGGCGDGYSTYGCGTVYELSPTSGGYVETILYSFITGNSFEGNPAGPLVFDKSGNLYGTAQTGGTGAGCYYYGCGTVFKLTKGTSGWTESTIYDFTGVNDGDTPGAGVTFDTAGNLYGTTEGYWGYGSIFELSPNSDGSWAETTLFSSDPNYSSFYGGVIFDTAGNLYATALDNVSNSCTGGCGEILELSHGSSGWTKTTLYSFTGGKDGDAPYATLLRDSGGNLYTTTSAGANGAGSVFKLAPASGGAWKGTVLYDFPVNNEGTVPYSGLLADGAGNYYGTTTAGGTASSGTVYKLSPTSTGGWKETVIYNFTNTNGDGAYPLGNLLLDAAGNLYGTTQLGGMFTFNCFDVNSEQCGTVFKLSPKGDGTWTESILHTFTGYNSGDGANPSAGLIMDSSGNLYGTTRYGGTHDGGTAFLLTPSSGGSWTETVLASFGNGFSDAWDPSGPLTRDSQGNLYGTSDSISSNGYPTVFRLSPSGTGWTESVLFSFTTQYNGYSPEGGVVLDSEGNLYGVTYRGGLNQGGIVYKLTPSSGTWTQTVLHNFTGVNGDGAFPQATLTFDAAGNLFGTTVYGGLYNGACQIGCGTVFELSPTSNGSWGERVLHHFAAGKDGALPWAPVTLDSAGNVVGSATSGGSGASGLVFEIKP